MVATRRQSGVVPRPSAKMREAAAAWQEQADDREAHARRKQVEEMWRRTLNALAVRCRLQAEYGGGGSSGGGGEAM